MKSEPQKQRLLIAGGGTGGHIFPAVAVAETFLARSENHEVLFVNTGRPLDRKILGDRDLPFACITVASIKGKGLWQTLKALSTFPLSLWKAFVITGKYRPHALLAVGGHAAAPAALAAKMRGIPLLLHEQNKLPGLTTRLLSRLAAEVHVSFPGTRLPVKAKKIFVSGNPVRRELVACRTRKRKKTETFRLLVLGGSQGARGLNRAVCQTLPLLNNLPLEVVHQTGEADRIWVREAYEKAGIKGCIQAFIQDMHSCYRETDFVLCRAGATTVAELAAVGLGAVFIPFPHAADNHQYHNARAMADIGAARILEEKTLDPEILAQILTEYARNPEATESMATAALTLSRPDAATTLTDALMRRMLKV